MEIVIEKNTFLKALQIIQSIVEKRNTMPILANALIRTGHDSIDIVATDLEVGIKESVPAEVRSEGVMTVSARKLFEIVKELPMESLTLKKKENNWIEIVSGKALFNMVGIDPEDFPSFPSCDDVKLMEISDDILKDMIDKTAVAISSDETRYNLNGAFLEGTEAGKVRLVATDGHRLALTERELDKGDVALGEEGYIIPRKGVQEFRKLMEESDGSVQLGFKDNRAILKKGDKIIVVRLIEGEFPDYRQVIPSSRDNVIKINRVEFIKSLRRISILSDEKTKGVKFEFSADNLVVSTTNPGLGEAKEELGIDYNGNDIAVGFNARYVLDFLNVMAEEDVTIYIADELSAAVMRDGSRDDYTAIVMPMRT
ncbi:MAG: DNA polymerase III subunit beta [Deltaproteobacteria bacterium]|nr:DNA polymerase III subunit beta [Deltaproteobacteria bacterium]